MKLAKLYGELVEYLEDNNWKIDSQNVFYKNTKHLNRRKEDFLSYGVRKSPFFLEDVLSKVANNFVDLGFDYHKPISIRRNGSTIFTSAGIQVLTDSDRKISSNRGYVAQPVVRTQNFGAAKLYEGSSTSFVNLTTFQKDASISDYIYHMDSWMNTLSSLGLYMGDFELTLKESQDNWGEGDFQNLVLKLLYGGLELGDFCFAQEISINGQKTNICDFGFGLERLAWATNKTKSYYDVIFPSHSISNIDRHSIDSLRTSILLAQSGVSPSIKGEGWRLRSFLKDGCNLNKLNLDSLLSNFYNFWDSLAQSELSYDNSKKAVIKEINRSTNLGLCKKIGLREPREENLSLSPDDFICLLVKNYNFNFEDFN